MGLDITQNLEFFVKIENYYDIPSPERALAGVDAIINAYSLTPVLDLDGHLILLRATERAGIKVFIASSWSHDLTNIRFGDFERYNNHKAFQYQTANTSLIKPVYIISGILQIFCDHRTAPGPSNPVRS